MTLPAPDAIVEETRAARDQLFARFGYKLDALCAYLREREHTEGRRVVTLPPRRPEPTPTSS